MKFSMTDDILIQVTSLKEVTTWADLTIIMMAFDAQLLITIVQTRLL